MIASGVVIFSVTFYSKVATKIAHNVKSQLSHLEWDHEIMGVVLKHNIHSGSILML